MSVLASWSGRQFSTSPELAQRSLIMSRPLTWLDAPNLAQSEAKLAGTSHRASLCKTLKIGLKHVGNMFGHVEVILGHVGPTEGPC